MGYDPERFVGEVHESLFCGICLDVLQDPVMIKECEHIYCRECITTSLNNRQGCPQDRMAFAQESLIKPHRFFFNIYDSLKIKCDANKVKTCIFMPIC